MKRARQSNHLTALVLVLVLAMVVAACGGSAETTTTTAPPDDATTTTGGGDGDTTTTGGEAPADGLVIDGELIVAQDILDEAMAGPPGILYSSANEEASIAIVEKFTEDTGVAMELVRATPNVLYERILSEAGAGQLPADAFYMTWEYVTSLADQGIIVPFIIPSFDEFDERFKHPDGAGYAVDLSTVVLTYNTAIVPPEEVPTKWTDMLNPALVECGVGVPQPGLGASGWVTAMFQRKVLGESFWADVAATNPNIYTSNSTTAQDLARGEICIAPVTGVSTRNAIEDGAPVAFVVPEEGIPVYTTWTGIGETGDNSAAGKAFVSWLTSTPGMRFAAVEGGRYAPRIGLDAPFLGPDPEHQLPPIDAANVWQPDSEEWVSLRETWTQEWYEIYGYVPTEG